MADVDRLQIEIEASSNQAEQQIRSLTAALKELKSTLGGTWKNPIKDIQRGTNGRTTASKERESAKERVQRQTSQFHNVGKSVDAVKLTKELDKIDAAIEKTSDKLLNLQNQLETMESVKGISGNAASKTLFDQSEYDNLKAQIEEVAKLMDALDVQRREALAGLDTSVSSGGFTEAKEEITEVEQRTRILKDAFKSLASVGSSVKKSFSGVFSGLANSAKNALKPIKNLMSSFGRIALYRGVRTVIKGITDAISTGMTNAYQYSKIIGGDLAKAFDSLSSASFVAKNQLGAAFATALASIIPTLIQIINLATQAAAALAQLFAVLGGSGTYLKANTGYMKSWGNETKKAGGAAKELKNATLGIDELNVISDTGGGGGGGGADALDFADMFDETPLDAWALKVKDVLDWVKSHLDLVKDVAIAVGAALLGWKLAKGFTNSLSKTLGIAMAFAGAVLYVKGFIDAWKNGPDWKNLAEMISGVALAAIGLGIAFGPIAAGIAAVLGGVGMLAVGIKDWIKTGELATKTFWTLVAGLAAVGVGIALLTGNAGIGLLVAGVGALVIAITDWIKKGELSSKTFWMLEAGIIAVGAAIAILTGSWIPAVIAAVAVVVVAIVTHWNEIKEKTKEIWESITEWLKGVWESLKTTVSTIWTTIATTISTKWDNIKTTAKNKWTAIINELKQKWENIKTSASAKFDELKTSINSSWDAIKTIAITAWTNIKTSIVDIIGTLKNALAEKWNAIKDWWGSLELPQFKIKLPHFSISGKFSLDPPSIPSIGVSWYAKGGIVDGATLIGAGEAGKEAIIPLERNTGWIDRVSEGIVSKIDSNKGALSDADAIEGASDDIVTAILSIGTQIVTAINDSGNNNGGFTMAQLSRAITQAQNRTARSMGV